MSNDLIDRISSKSATIGVIGLGYVGLPLSLRFSEVGFKVIGFDVDATKIQSIESGESYINHICPTSIRDAVAHGFKVTSDFAMCGDVDAIIICVPTPLSVHREPDLSFVTNTMDAIGPYLRSGQIVSLESTTYPGTTDEEILPRILSKNLKVGEDIFLVYSPEREDPGNQKFKTSTIPKICGGYTNACLEVGLVLYQQIIERVVPVSSTRTAELTKLLENIHRAVNIGLVNEMKIVADKMGIDINEVIRAAATKPFGFVAYYPGPGLGGHCIPIDPFYLTWKAREYGVHTRFIELAGEVNSSMPTYVVSKVFEALNERRISVKGSRILVLGIAYKKNVDDMRESPAVVIMEKLSDLGANLSYSDPYIEKFPEMRDHPHFDLASVELSPEVISQFDCVLLTTDHDSFDYPMLLEHSRLLVDTRGRYVGRSPNVLKA